MRGTPRRPPDGEWEGTWLGEGVGMARSTMARGLPVARQIRPGPSALPAMPGP
jgi:hypothetical protein